jgi:pyruvate/2-oxoacid:ferredoxin oxidoreductase alpha subunit
VLKEVVEAAREQGLRVGLLRPVTLFPFPNAEIQRLARHAHAFAVVEMSTGQLVDDVRLALEGRRPVEFYSRVGGNVPATDAVLAFAREALLKHLREVVHA